MTRRDGIVLGVETRASGGLLVANKHPITVQRRENSRRNCWCPKSD